MLIPREKPFKDRIHSYYIIFEKFVACMQEEIGSGCIYCRSMRQEHMIYFNATKLLRCVAQDRGHPPRVYHQLGDVIEAFKVRPFIISVHYLDLHAVYFWGQLSPYRIEKKQISEIGSMSLESMVEQSKSDGFSGFFDITAENGESGLLFFQDGAMAGGSYTWGTGGLSPSQEDYRRLFALVEGTRCSLDVGTFTPGRSSDARK